MLEVGANVVERRLRRKAAHEDLLGSRHHLSLLLFCGSVFELSEEEGRKEQ